MKELLFLTGIALWFDVSFALIIALTIRESFLLDIMFFKFLAVTLMPCAFFFFCFHAYETFTETKEIYKEWKATR